MIATHEAPKFRKIGNRIEHDLFFSALQFPLETTIIQNWPNFITFIDQKDKEASPWFSQNVFYE